LTGPDLAAPAIGSAPAPKRINLALQGGGTHGAFTWGVLERLLEDERIVIDGVSGASAGAINAAVLVQGLARGGRAGAIEALGALWRDIAARMVFSPMQNTPVEKAIWGHDLTWSMAYQAFDTMTRMFSPSQFNMLPEAFNPMRSLLERHLDCAALRAAPNANRLYISATNVRSGQPRIFTRAELSIDAVLASACRRWPARSRSTVRPIGMEAIWAIPRCGPCITNAGRPTSCWCRSTPSCARSCRKRHLTS
jgi:NTE family protein